MWIGCGTALAEKRVALVIGNSAYKNAPRLANPGNDATLMGDMLRRSGFELVDVRLDLEIADMRKALRDFAGRAREADVAVIYYAGHGMELDGTNYLIPTDATLETDNDVLDETLPLERLLFAIEPARQLRLVILDGCRDNPFARTMKRTVATRAVGRGLARVEPASQNTMIAFAAKAGSTASDGNSGNGPFAAALVTYLPKPGLDLRKAFGFVRDDVLRRTNYRQEPYVYGSLGGDDMPLVPAEPAAQGPQPNPDDPVRKDYELALQLGTPGGWNAFLARYGDGFYADLAKGQLNKIAAEAARAAAAEKALFAEQESARLAAEGARKADQKQAALSARMAEQARIAAEEANKAEQAKSEAAELQRKSSEAAAANRTNGGDEKIAALSPSAPLPPSPTDLAKFVQLELRRVGCLAAGTDGNWDSASRRSLNLFNKYASTSFDAGSASMDALEALKARPSRVCPLSCARGYKADGDSCVKLACKPGFEPGKDGACEARPPKRAARQEIRRQDVSPRDKCFSYSGRTYC